MSLVSVRDIKNLLKRYKVHPLKRLGQIFLIDKGVIRKIIEAADLELEDVILEIGPGLGAITQEMAKKVKKIIGIEKDLKMTEILKETLKDCKNVEIVLGDILKIENWKLKIKNYKVVANLPFYLTAPVIRQFLETIEPRPQQMVLVVQKEAAQRICAKPPEMSILAVSVQFYAKPEIVIFVSKKSFWPQPKVDSAILRINPLMTTDKKLINTDLFFKVVRAGFSHPRKQLINNLSKEFLPAGRQGKLNREEVKDWLLKNNIQPEQRAETLTVENWISLTRIAMKGEEEIYLFDYPNRNEG